MADLLKRPSNVSHDDAKRRKLETFETDLSDEDKELQDELDMCIESFNDPNEELHVLALEKLRSHIKESTTSMTAVPKPLKYLRKHLPTLKTIYQIISTVYTKKLCADIISILGLTMSDGRDCLNYRLLGLNGDIGEWGHEYIRHLTRQISEQWLESDGNDDDANKVLLLDLAEKIIPYNLSHNSQAEACDLAMEINHLELLQEFVDEHSYKQVCAYITSCVPYIRNPLNKHDMLQSALKILKKFKQWSQVLQITLQLNDSSLAATIFNECPDPSIPVDINESIPDHSCLQDIISNTSFNANFLSACRELDILEPKSPKEIYKTNSGASSLNSSKQNLADSFVSGFVNAGFGNDALLTEDGTRWLYNNRTHGKLSATAALGLVYLWDADGGLANIDKYLYSEEVYIKAGALLGCGIVHCGVQNEIDSALALLSPSLEEPIVKTGAILGLALAYAGTNREDILQLLNPNKTDKKLQVIGLRSFSCGLVAVGTCNSQVTSSLLQCLLNLTAVELKDNSHTRFIALGLGLCCLGKQEAADDVLRELEGVPDPFKSMAITLVEVCAYAGTGNMAIIQKMLHICSEHYKPLSKSKSKTDLENEDAEKIVDFSLQQSVATLGIALLALGEDVGTEMAFRTFDHLVRYGDPPIRRAVPLALGLLSVSYPRGNVLEILSKLSHDLDRAVVINSIFAMGIVGAGTNNARVASMLRRLCKYYEDSPNYLFVINIAQGLVHMGKGTLGLSPFHSEGKLLCPMALAGLLCTLFTFLDIELILRREHYMLFCLAAAMNPRMLTTLDENLQPISVAVRVGQALDTICVPGDPRTITGFQTEATPVILGHGERAELATEEYIPLSHILEGVVILRKNPDHGT